MQPRTSAVATTDLRPGAQLKRSQRLSAGSATTNLSPSAQPSAQPSVLSALSPEVQPQTSAPVLSLSPVLSPSVHSGLVLGLLASPVLSQCSARAQPSAPASSRPAPDPPGPAPSSEAVGSALRPALPSSAGCSASVHRQCSEVQPRTSAPVLGPVLQPSSGQLETLGPAELEAVGSASDQPSGQPRCSA